jgi:hypothetical protein
MCRVPRAFIPVQQLTFGSSWASPWVQHLVHVLACFPDHIHRAAHRLTVHEFLDNDGSQDQHQLLDLRFHVHLVLQLESKSDYIYPIQIHEETSHQHVD